MVSVTATLDASHVGMQIRLLACPVGSGTLSEVARFDNESGLSLFGANPVIDKNRGVRLRSTTIAGAVTPSAAGALFHHSDAQGGAGEVAVDTGSFYRHAGQAAVRKLTTDADATYTPRADGRIVRDSAALTVDRKLVLATTNVTDGHKLDVSRRGSSGGHNRAVYQADGTTLIANVADNASADFIYDVAGRCVVSEVSSPNYPPPRSGGGAEQARRRKPLRLRRGRGASTSPASQGRIS